MEKDSRIQDSYAYAPSCDPHGINLVAVNIHSGSIHILNTPFLLAYSTETFHVQPAPFPETEKTPYTWYGAFFLGFRIFKKG